MCSPLLSKSASVLEQKKFEVSPHWSKKKKLNFKLQTFIQLHTVSGFRKHIKCMKALGLSVQKFKVVKLLFSLIPEVLLKKEDNIVFHPLLTTITGKKPGQFICHKFITHSIYQAVVKTPLTKRRVTRSETCYRISYILKFERIWFSIDTSEVCKMNAPL